jgi:soluble lytic murein transglycosylase-like protein
MADKTKADFQAILRRICSEKSLDQALLEAIIEAESAWNPNAMRFELSFPYIENPKLYARRNKITPKTEHYLQKFSWGLCQIMGCTARGLGYMGPLVQLIDPEINLQMMAKYVLDRCMKYPFVDKQIAAYNAGSVQLTETGQFINQNYVDKVLKIMKGS